MASARINLVSSFNVSIVLGMTVIIPVFWIQQTAHMHGSGCQNSGHKNNGVPSSTGHYYGESQTR